jgi:polysaccharide export outer membrane protein
VELQPVADLGGAREQVNACLDSSRSAAGFLNKRRGVRTVCNCKNCEEFMYATRFIQAGRTLLLLAAGALLAGCASAHKSTANAEGPQGVFKPAEGHDLSSADEYIVDPPDEITLQAPNIKELDKQKAIVRPDGKIGLNLLGEVKVAGLTPNQINLLLQKAASKYYVNPDIKCEVKANSKFFNVVGLGMNKGGRIPFTGIDTVVSAVADAGFNPQAWPQQVLLSRPGKNGQPPATAVVDFTKVFEEGRMEQNYLLEPGDIIDVRYSPMAVFEFKVIQAVGPVTGVGSIASTPGSIAGH